MILPNKAIKVSESSLFKATKILPFIENNMSPIELYNITNKYLIDIPDFIQALDVLFVLGKIKLDLDNEVIIIA
ncbi:ABC-three component system middle component 7 [Gilliamella sp. BG1]|uniref:ABC-three component system middle component 7 n=1 Tax=Gilliamella sp. BG1 TaxID=3351508 RepID=UPI0039861DD5